MICQKAKQLLEGLDTITYKSIEYQLVDRIGFGSFGVVYDASYSITISENEKEIETNQFCAVKFVFTNKKMQNKKLHYCKFYHTTMWIHSKNFLNLKIMT